MKKSAKTRLDTRDSVRIENAIDVGAAPLDLAVESLAQFRVAAAHTHRDVVDEREEWRIDLWRERRDLERKVLGAREVARLRTPNDRNVDVAARYGVHERVRS